MGKNMPPKTSMADFTALVRRSGLSLTDAQIAEIYQGWGYIERMLERIRVPGRGREAELALTFKPEGS
jgi:hypothetical protein